MFSTPYQTTVLKDFNIAGTKLQLEQLYIRDKESLVPAEKYQEFTDKVLVLNTGIDSTNIPLFSNPILINTDATSNNNKYNKFIVDCRAYTTRNKDGQLVVTKPAAYHLSILNAVLANAWYHEGPERFSSISKFPVKVFSHWITSTIARRLNIDEIAQVRANVIIGYYFLCMFEDFKAYDARELLDDDKAYIFSVKIAYASGLKINDTINIIKEIPTMSSIHDLEKALKEFGGSERFKLFNPAFLYTLIGRTAIFNASPEMIYAALEYPPAFYMMVFISAVEKGYNKSGIGNVVHNYRNTEDVKYFCRMVNDIADYKTRDWL